MHDIPNGWLRAVVTYQCKWCMRTETITFEDGVVNFEPIAGWREYRPDCRSGSDLCSSDCERERDEAYNQATANLEPVPRRYHSVSKGFQEEVERLRIIKMKERT